MAEPVPALRSVAALREAVAPWRAAGARVGLVPTMGALHAAHYSLVEAARQRCDRVVASIFVNPKQFGPNEDFASYPRQEEADRRGLAEYGVDAAYCPSAAEMYPAGFATTVSVGGPLAADLCAADRPGHFDGVATVVAKLLIQAGPDEAFFGEKDFQQLQIIRRLATDLDLPTAIHGCPIVRESDGLALSSRNSYLDGPARATAPQLYATLHATAERLAAGNDVGEVLDSGRQHLARHFDAVDYLAYRRASDLAPLATAPPAEPARVLAAVRLAGTRLIDNVPVAAAP